MLKVFKGGGHQGGTAETKRLFPGGKNVSEKFTQCKGEGFGGLTYEEQTLG